MLEETEKRSFTVNSCLINKELVSKIGEVVKHFKTIYTLDGDTKDIKTNNVALFVGVEWPSDISKICIQSSGPSGKVNIDLDFDGVKNSYCKFVVRGSDPIWVEGVAGKLKSVFRSARLWYYLIAEYWSLRILFSAVLMLLIAWRVNHSLWFVISQHISLPEMSFFLAIFVVSFCLSVYPLDRFLSWIFPRYEFEQNIQRKIRKYFATILAILVTWVLTNILFPALIP